MIKNSVKINLYFALNYLQTESPTAVCMVINPSKTLKIEKNTWVKANVIKIWIISFLRSFKIVLFKSGYGSSSTPAPPDMNK